MTPATTSTGRPLILALAAYAAFLIIGISSGPSRLTGDETEYFAMLYGWGTYGSPTLTAPVVRFIRSVYPDRPDEPTSIQAVDGSYDAAHFWFFSLLATPFFWLCKASGLDWRHSFTFLNGLFFAWMMAVCDRHFRWRGVTILTLGLLCSPLLPYLNKAHADCYTVCLIALAALYLTASRILSAAVALSLAATQISTFAPFAGALLLFWGYRAWRERAPRKAWAVVAACGGLLTLQPLWTLWRHHALVVLVKMGFARPEMVTPMRVLAIFVDPDVGLAFTWPLGLVLGLLIAIGARRHPAGLRTHWIFWTFAIGATPVLAYIAANNWNYSAAAPRYSLWFAPLLLVGFVLVLKDAPRGKGLARIGTLLFLLGCAANGYYNIVVRGVQPTLVRSPLAELWYRWLPGVYDPDPQVFCDFSIQQQFVSGWELFQTGRYPLDVLPDRRIWAISNRSCTKLLVFAYGFTSSSVASVLPANCREGVDPALLLQYVRKTTGPPMRDRFVSVPQSALRRMALVQNTPSITTAAVNYMPRVVSIATSEEKGAEARYTFRFSDRNGWQDLGTLLIIVTNQGADPELKPPCYVAYNQPHNLVTLPLESGTGGASVTLGKKGILRSKGCSIDASRATVSAQDDTLTLQLYITANPQVLMGRKVVLAGATDLKGATSGWVSMDQGKAANASPNVALKERAGEKDTLDIEFAYDSRALKDVAKLLILINRALDGSKACYLRYEPARRVVELLADDGAQAKAMGMPLSGKGTLRNGQCLLDGEASRVTISGGSVRLQLHVVLSGLAGGNSLLWAADVKDDGSMSPWQQVGAWPQKPPEIHPTRTASLRLDANDSELLSIDFAYSRPGLKDVATIWILINDALDARKACYLTYVPALGVLYLTPNDGDAGKAAHMQLADRLSLENTQCKIDGAGSSASANADTLTLRLRIIRKGGFRSAKHVWTGGQDNKGHVTSWEEAGAWALPASVRP